MALLYKRISKGIMLDLCFGLIKDQNWSLCHALFLTLLKGPFLVVLCCIFVVFFEHIQGKHDELGFGQGN